MTRNIQYKKLGEICDFISGGTPSKSKNEYWKNGNIPWIKISDFKEKYIKFSEEKITKIGLENSSAKILKKGTILYTIFASVGKVAILDIEATTNQAIVGINLKEDNSIDKDFLYYFLSSIENNIKKQARGVAQNNINISILKNINIPILPMSFQKNIVKTLNKLENILENFKQKKLLINFLNKSLFSRMFGDIKTNDKNWEIKKLGEVVETQYGTSKKATSVVGEFPILRMNNITYSGEMDYKDLKYIELSDSEKEKFLLKKGELLFNRTNSKELVGKTGLFNLDIPMAFAGYLIRIKPSNLIHSKFLLFFMNSEFMKKLLYNKAKNIVGMANINAKELEDFSIILPPIELQNKFAERIEKIEKLKFEIEKSIEVAQNLYDSLISKYFDN